MYLESEILTPHHFDPCSGFSDVLYFYAIRRSFTLRLVVSIASLTVKVSLVSQAVLLLQSQMQRLFCNCINQRAVQYCSPIFVGCSMLVSVDWAVPYHAYMFVGCSAFVC